MINKIIQSIKSGIVIKIFIKIFCFIIMSITYFISYFFCGMLADYCSKINFMMLGRFEVPHGGLNSAFAIFGIMLDFYILYIICYYAISILFYIFSILEKKITRNQYSLIKKIHFLHFCIFIIIMVELAHYIFYINDIFGYIINDSHLMKVDNIKLYMLILSLMMGIMTYMKIYCIDKNKYGTFAIIIIGEIVVPIIFAIWFIY